MQCLAFLKMIKKQEIVMFIHEKWQHFIVKLFSSTPWLRGGDALTTLTKCHRYWEGKMSGSTKTTFAAVVVVVRLATQTVQNQLQPLLFLALQRLKITMSQCNYFLPLCICHPRSIYSVTLHSFEDGYLNHFLSCLVIFHWSLHNLMKISVQ